MNVEHKDNELAILLYALKQGIEKTLRKITYLYNKDLRGFYLEYIYNINNTSVLTYFTLQNNFSVCAELDPMLEDTIKIKVILTKFDCEEIILHTYCTNISDKEEHDYDFEMIRSQLPVEWL